MIKAGPTGKRCRYGRRLLKRQTLPGRKPGGGCVTWGRGSGKNREQENVRRGLKDWAWPDFKEPREAFCFCALRTGKEAEVTGRRPATPNFCCHVGTNIHCGWNQLYSPCRRVPFHLTGKTIRGGAHQMRDLMFSTPADERAKPTHWV